MLGNRPEEDNDQALDRLLAEARWPEPDPEQLARLRQRWASLDRRRRPRRTVLVATATAASVFLATGVIAWRMAQGPNTAQLLPAGQGRDAPAVAIVQETPPSREERRVRAEPRDQFSGREPTLYEQVALSGSMRGVKKPRQLAVRKRLPQPGQAAALASLKDRMAKQLASLFPLSAEDAGGQMARLAVGFGRWQRQSSAIAVHRTVSLMGRVFSTAGRRQLEVARPSSPHEVDVETVIRCGTPRTIANFVVFEGDATLRRRLLAALAARGTFEAVEAYLGFVALPDVRLEALAALADVPEFPSGVLLAFLRAPTVSLRESAALALARSTNPDVIAALAASLGDAGSRQPALVALLLNPAPQAAALVDEARGNLYLTASVRAAEFELHRLTQTP